MSLVNLSGIFVWSACTTQNITFHQLGPLGRVGLVVAKSVSVLSVCLSPSHAIFLRGRTGAERAFSVDWCNLNLKLDLE